MTYCVGVQVDEGLVFLSDSRTNAGVDHVSTFRKMTFFEMPGERVIVLLSSGNLAVSQSVTGLLRERVTSAKASQRVNFTSATDSRIVSERSWIVSTLTDAGSRCSSVGRSLFTSSTT